MSCRITDSGLNHLFSCAAWRLPAQIRSSQELIGFGWFPRQNDVRGRVVRVTPPVPSCAGARGADRIRTKVRANHHGRSIRSRRREPLRLAPSVWPRTKCLGKHGSMIMTEHECAPEGKLLWQAPRASPERLNRRTSMRRSSGDCAK